MEIAREEHTNGPLVKGGQPWVDRELAQLYDVFPFDADTAFYSELAAQEGGRILELGCGSGRLLFPLARAGSRVTGVDVSEPMLEIAQRKLISCDGRVGERVRLVQADMRQVALGESFDLAVIPVKTFAYLTDRTDQQMVLERVAAHLRPNGLLALDLLHPTPAWLSEPPGSLRQDLVQCDPERGITLLRTEAVVSVDLERQIRTIRSIYDVVHHDGSATKRIVEWPFRYVFRYEAEHLLERAGFRIEALYGGYRREPFTSQSRDMVFLARRMP